MRASSSLARSSAPCRHKTAPGFRAPSSSTRSRAGSASAAVLSRAAQLAVAAELVIAGVPSARTPNGRLGSPYARLRRRPVAAQPAPHDLDSLAEPDARCAIGPHGDTVSPDPLASARGGDFLQAPSLSRLDQRSPHRPLAGCAFRLPGMAACRPCRLTPGFQPAAFSAPII